MIKNVALTEPSIRGDRQWDIFSRLLKDRIVFINGPIEDDLAATVVGQILFLEKEDHKKPINLYINSPGGYITSGMAIYDTMNFVSCPVHTLCIGQAASMAAVLLSAGAPGFRRSLEYSSMMIHQPHGGSYGQASDIVIQADNIKYWKGVLNQILAKNCGQALSLVEKDTDRDFYMTAEDAVKYGLVDKVVTKR